jgi:hypothetical protein
LRKSRRALAPLTAALFVAGSAVASCSSPTPSPPADADALVAPMGEATRTATLPPIEGYPFVPTVTPLPEGYVGPTP